MIGSCLQQYGYSFKSKNNCCSVYMNKTFYGHTPNVNGLLNLDSSDTHIHSVETKRCRVDNGSATYLWHCRLGHIGVQRMKKPKFGPKTKTACVYFKGTGHCKRNCPKYLADKKDGKVKCIFDIHV